MSSPRSMPPSRVPTLTEVVEFDAPAPAQAPVPAAAPPEREGVEPAGQLGASDLRSRILTDVQRQLDAGLESHVRAAVEPALARCAEALVRDLQDGLAATLRELVERAVEHEHEHQRERLRGAASAELPARRDGGTTPD